MIELTRREFLCTGVALFAPQEKGLVVHEWGVLTVPQEATWAAARTGGARIEKGAEIVAPPPDFANTWTGAVGKRIEEWKNEPIIIDKPIVYFYSDVARAVDLRVDVPLGRPHCWWPPAREFAPMPVLPNRNGGFRGSEVPEPGPIESIKPEKGFLHWEIALDPKIDRGAMRRVDPSHWWHVARQTDSCPLRSSSEVEKFVFYDALSPVTPSLEVDIEKRLVRNVDTVEIPWAVAIDGDRISCAESIGPGAEIRLQPGKADLEARLRKAGLYDKEAAGLVRIWRSEFFEADGMRVLYPMPEPRVRLLLPMQIRPEPEKLVRVLLVQIECLTERMRREIQDLVVRLGEEDLDERERATAELQKFGPRAEGPLRRAWSTAEDSEVRARIAMLLSRIGVKP